MFLLTQKGSIKDLTLEEVEKWYKRFKIDVPAKNGQIGTWKSVYNDKIKIIKTDLWVSIIFKMTTNFDLHVRIMRAFQEIGIDMTEVWNLHMGVAEAPANLKKVY